MAAKRTYTIEIDGLKESYEGVKSLAEVLSELSGTTVNVSEKISGTTEKVRENASETTQATEKKDALAKAEEKLANYDEQYQTKLAEVNKQLSNNKKAINEQIKIQEAQATVDAKQLGSYREKQQYLSALNTLIRTHSDATEADRAEIEKMVVESAKLQSELKAFDENMKIYTRNVGNYPEAANMVINAQKSVKQELRETQMAMTEMLRNGVSKTDPAFVELAKKAGALKDAMMDASNEIKNFASDTRQLDNVINLAQTATSVWGLYNSAMAIFGEENEEVAKSMQKMMAIMQALNSLQTISTALTANGSATARIYSQITEYLTGAKAANTAATQANTAATGANTAANTANTASESANATATGAATTALAANTAATGAATVATKALSIAIKSIPIMFVLGLLIALIQNWEELVGWFTDTFPVLKKVQDYFNKTGGIMAHLKASCKALGDAIINWVVNPFKTMANVVKKVLEGDFAGAMDAAMEGIKNQFMGTVDAMANGYKKSMAEAAEKVTLKNLQETNKQTKQQLAELKIQERNNKTYSDKYIKLQKKDFEERKRIANGNKEELDKIKLEEMQFYADVEDKKTASLQKNEKARTSAVKKELDNRKKSEAEYLKEIQKLHTDAQAGITEAQKNIHSTYIETLKTNNEIYKKNIDEATRYYGNYTVEIEKNMSRIKQLQKQLAEETDEIRENELVDAIAKLEEENKKYKEYRQEVLAVQQSSYVKSRELSVQQMLKEANDTKEHYEKILENLRNLIKRTKEQLVTASGDTAETLKADLDKLQEKYRKVSDDMSRDLGYFRDVDIDVPVTFKFDNVDRLYDNLANISKADLEYQIEVTVDEEYRNELKNILDNWDKVVATVEQDGMLIEKTGADMWMGFSKADAINGVFGKLDVLKQHILDVFSSGNELKGMFNTLGIDDKDAIADVFRNADKYIEDYKEKFPEFSKALKEWKKDYEKSLDSIGNFAAVMGVDADEAMKVIENLKDQAENFAVDFSLFFDLDDEQAEEFKKKAIDMADGFARTLQGQNLSITPSVNPEKIEKQLTDLGYTAAEVYVEISKMGLTAAKEMNEELIRQSEDAINGQEKLIKSFQDTYQHITFEPVMVTDSFSKYWNDQIMSIEKTKERYAELKEGITDYAETLREGSEQRLIWEANWQKKLEATRNLYGENSDEYILMVNEHKTATASMNKAFQDSQILLEKITVAEEKTMADYFASLSESINNIAQQLNSNIFGPLADGFSALLDFQLEEAQERLEEVEELWDRAVELREESQQRIAEINTELRNGDVANKEILKQQLADEQVLLVERTQNERDLQKQKERAEKEVQKKEKAQRKIELGQKLIEGIVNTAVGVTAALKYGPILGPIFAALIGSMGALQTGIIIKQISKLERGGKIRNSGVVEDERGQGRRHAQGGHRIEGTNIEVEYGEWVINRNSSKKYHKILEAINQDNEEEVSSLTKNLREKKTVGQIMTSTGETIPMTLTKTISRSGDTITNVVNNYNTVNNYNSRTKTLASSVVSKFERGGQFNYSDSVKAIEQNSQSARMEAQMMKMDFNPVVSVVDIHKKEASMAKVEDLAGK